MLPFDLPSLSRGYAELGRAAREAGARASVEASRALAAVTGVDVTVTGRAVPAVAGARLGAVRLAIELAEVPGTAVLEVEPGLVAALVDRLAGGAGEVAGASALTPVEASALELLALAALDGACAVPELESRLCPRLVRAGPEPRAPLAVELDVRAGAVRGRARLLFPASAVRALRAAGGALDPDVAGSGALPLSLRGPTTALLPAELAALAPGDVVLCDPAPAGRHALVLPGGARLSGAVEGDSFHVEEVHMTQSIAEIPVTLEVELARITVSLAELARLEPGAVLPLPVDRSGQVALRAGERLVARGELVDVDGAIGVRVTAREVAP